MLSRLQVCSISVLGDYYRSVLGKHRQLLFQEIKMTGWGGSLVKLTMRCCIEHKNREIIYTHMVPTHVFSDGFELALGSVKKFNKSYFS